MKTIPAALPSSALVTHHTCRNPCRLHALFTSPSRPSSRLHSFQFKVKNESTRTEVSPDPAIEKSEADKIVDSMDFGELCNEFECKSSPLVESTARQLARDILELREGNRALGTYAASVKYKDPVRSYTGRDKYKRPLWVTDALENPSAVRILSFGALDPKGWAFLFLLNLSGDSESVQEMVMLSTSLLRIKWTVRGKPKSLLANVGGDLIIRVTSQFTLNQISGQVIEHEELWDLSASSAIAQAYFWTSRRLFATSELGKDVIESVKNLTSRFSEKKENMEIYPDPYGDPTKFFQGDQSFQRDVYQIALLIAIVYFVIQFLKITL